MLSVPLRRTFAPTWIKAAGVLLFAALTAVSARVSVPLPFTPVPLSLQVLAVVLSGLVLGAAGGAVSQLLVLQAILLGAPLTAYGLAGPAAFTSPTAGYLVAFPLAAGLAGWFSQRTSVRLLGRIAGGVGALVVIYALGAAWLAGYVGGMAEAFRLGVAPFVLVDALKVAIAVSVLSVRR